MVVLQPIRWNYLSWTYIGCIWRLHSVGSLMWLAVNKPLGHFSLSCSLTFLFMKQKMRALLLQKAGSVLQWLTLQGTGTLFTWRCTQTYCTFTNKHTHAVYRRHVIHRQEAEIHKHTHAHTHSMQQRAFSVGWKNELPVLYYQDDSSGSNQWKQDESPYQRRKMQTRRASQNKKTRSLAGIRSCI